MLPLTQFSLRSFCSKPQQVSSFSYPSFCPCTMFRQKQDQKSLFGKCAAVIWCWLITPALGGTMINTMTGGALWQLPVIMHAIYKTDWGTPIHHYTFLMVLFWPRLSGIMIRSGRALIRWWAIDSPSVTYCRVFYRVTGEWGAAV